MSPAENPVYDDIPPYRPAPGFAQARWITAPEFLTLAPLPRLRRQLADDPRPVHRDDLQHHVWMVRSSVLLHTLPGVASLLISADDHYRLWINGHLVGIGPAPGYPHHTFYNDRNVRSYLRQGENVIAVQVYYQGLVNRTWYSADHRQGLIAELFADGASVTASGGPAWRASRSQAFTAIGRAGYDTQLLERFDSRLHDPAWRQGGFDDADWAPAPVHLHDDHQLVRQPTPPLTLGVLAPVSRQALPEGGWLIDFGGEITGELVATASGPAGARIELRCGEELLADGRVRHAMRCNCDYRDEWLLSGQPRDVLEQIDYKGFRYVELLPAGGAVIEPGSIRALARHYPLAHQLSCTSSEPRLDSIIALCARTLKFGAQDGILDCPTREKGQYLGDLTVSGLAHVYLSGDTAYQRKCLMDFASSAVVCPGLMAVAPSAFMQEIADYSLQWPSQLLRYVRHSGDTEVLTEAMPVLSGLMAYFARFQRPDGLLSDVTQKWNLVDWPANLRDSYDFPLTDPTQPGIHAVISAFWITALADANQLAAMAGLPPFGDPERVRAAFRAAFWREDQQLFADTPTSQHCALQTNVLALVAGAAPAGGSGSILALIEAKRFSCGVYMAFFVLKALAGMSAWQALWELLLDEGEHSWANMLREGATTCFEAWGKDQKWNTSLCHPWACAPIPILIEDLLGLAPARPGWGAISFRPRLPASLASLEVRLQLPCGEVRVVHRDGHTRLEAPAGIEVLSG